MAASRSSSEPRLLVVLLYKHSKQLDSPFFPDANGSLHSVIFPDSGSTVKQFAQGANRRKEVILRASRPRRCDVAVPVVREAEKQRRFPVPPLLPIGQGTPNGKLLDVS